MKGLLQTADIQIEEVERYRHLIAPAFDCDFFQLTPGKANGRLTLVSNDTAILYRETFGARIRAVGSLREGYVAIAFPSETMIGRSKWWHSDQPLNGVPARISRRDVDVSFDQYSDKYVLVMERNRFRELFRILAGYEPDLFGLDEPFISVPRENASACREAYAAYLEILVRGGENTAQEEFEIRLVDILAKSLVSPIQTFYTPQQKRGLVQRALEEIDTDRQIAGVAGLCLKLKASRRALTYAFGDCLGVSPAQYLRLHRLNRCRETFAHSGPGEISVHEVAEEMGFRGSGQFASLYRDFFGEYPSETLKRPVLAVNPPFLLL